VKIKYVCDCCENIFKEEEIFDPEKQAGFPTLTEEKSHDIILEDHKGSGMYISSTCDECNKALGLDGEHDIVFYRQPLIH